MSADDPTAAGASAREQYARRTNARRQAAARHGLVGRVVAALAGEPAHVHAWRAGADGEAATARALHARLARTDVIVLHDRRQPGRGRANIDHIAIAPAGVTVIDSKSSRGRVQLTSSGIIHRREQLLVGGRDRTGYLDKLARQIDLVAGVLERDGVIGIPVRGALSFPYLRREWLHNARALNGLITVDDPAHIAKHLKRPGPIAGEEIAWLAELLCARLLPATAQR